MKRSKMRENRSYEITDSVSFIRATHYLNYSYFSF
jgi:hypothetical protein